MEAVEDIKKIEVSTLLSTAWSERGRENKKGFRVRREGHDANTTGDLSMGVKSMVIGYQRASDLTSELESRGRKKSLFTVHAIGTHLGCKAK